jgi:SEC-C motif-containing protein
VEVEEFGEPARLILERSHAFGRGDFGFIYDSYHSQSNFRRQFEARDNYIAYGRETLSGDYRIRGCRILAEEVDEREARVIFLLEMILEGTAVRYAELAWLLREEGRWCYHRGQKITNDELPETPEDLSFADFAHLDPSTIF